MIGLWELHASGVCLGLLNWYVMSMPHEPGASSRAQVLDSSMLQKPSGGQYGGLARHSHEPAWWQAFVLHHAFSPDLRIASHASLVDGRLT